MLVHSEGSGDNRKIWITLFKSKLSEKGRFWRSVIRGDKDVDAKLNKPPVYGINPDDPSSIRSAMEQVSSFCRRVEDEIVFLSDFFFSFY